jgi:hypothetical protein
MLNTFIPLHGIILIDLILVIIIEYPIPLYYPYLDNMLDNGQTYLIVAVNCRINNLNCNLYRIQFLNFNPL